MKKRLLAVAVIVTFLFGTLAYAQEYDAKIPAEEMQVIAAEDIGITPMQDIKEEEESEVVLEENEKNFEESEETVPEETPEGPETQEDTKEEPEVETPEGTVEGYISNTFYKPEEHTECDYIHCIYFDEDTGTYTYEEWCSVCGEGTGRQITEEEFDVLDVECDVEF